MKNEGKTKKSPDELKGLPFWKKGPGRPKDFETPEEMLREIQEAFTRMSKPLYETKAFHTNGMVTKTKVPKMRIFSRKRLCLELGVSESYFRNFKATERVNKDEFLTVIEWAENVIDTQQLEGAASDLMNANIISRILGLVDKKDLTTNGKELPAPADLSKYSDDELKQLIELQSKGRTGPKMDD